MFEKEQDGDGGGELFEESFLGIRIFGKKKVKQDETGRTFEEKGFSRYYGLWKKVTPQDDAHHRVDGAAFTVEEGRGGHGDLGLNTSHIHTHIHIHTHTYTHTRAQGQSHRPPSSHDRISPST